MLPDIEPYYAVKCNSNPVLLKVLFLLGCNFDCASENEIKNILKITGTLPELFLRIHVK